MIKVRLVALLASPLLAFIALLAGPILMATRGLACNGMGTGYEGSYTTTGALDGREHCVYPAAQAIDIADNPPSCCSKCPPGKNNSASLDVYDYNIKCADCPRGHFIATQGSTYCDACPVGRHQYHEGQSRCDLCIAGTFAGGEATLNCSLCPSGSFSAGEGASSCSSCAAGKFNPVSGASTCVECPAGSSNDEGASSCARCPPGSIAATSGLAQCSQCLPGSFSPVAGSSICVECPLGTSSNTMGAVSCDRCPAGSIAGSTGMTACVACESGSSALIPGMSECIPESGANGGNTNNVIVGIFAESFGPGSRDFVTGSMAQAMAADGVMAITDIQFVPFGNTLENADGTFTCQHGASECKADMIIACAINEYPNQAQHWPFIVCMENGNPAVDGSSCATKSGLTWATIDNCFNNQQLSQSLMSDFAVAKNLLNPPLQYAPWVTINGVPQYMDLDNIKWKICAAYRGPAPSGCSEAADIAFSWPNEAN